MKKKIRVSKPSCYISKPFSGDFLKFVFFLNELELIEHPKFLQPFQAFLVYDMDPDMDPFQNKVNIVSNTVLTRFRIR